MPSFEFRANNETMKSAGKPDEKTRVMGPALRASGNSDGVFAGKPAHADVAIERRLPMGDGDLVLCRVAAESQLWINRDQSDKQWPQLTLVFDVPQGNGSVPVQRHDLERLLIDGWRLHWKGDGPEGLTGTGFTEDLRLRAYRVTKTSLAKNDSVFVKLGQ